jgi:hypothetical protein
MRLTSPTTQYLTIALAVLATVAVLLLWNRVRGPRAVRILSRIGLLLSGYAATAVAVLVSVNIAYGGLIVSVSDLFADLNPPMNQHFGHMHHHGRGGGYPGFGPHPTSSATPRPAGTASAAAAASTTATATATTTPTASVHAGANAAGVAGLAG